MRLAGFIFLSFVSEVAILIGMVARTHLEAADVVLVAILRFKTLLTTDEDVNNTTDDDVWTGNLHAVLTPPTTDSTNLFEVTLEKSYSGQNFT